MRNSVESSDICIAYPVVGEVKWQRIAALAKNGASVTVNCDSQDAARGLSKAAAKAGVTINVHIDIDSGLHRGGIPCEDELAIRRLADEIRSLPGLELAGITTYRSTGFLGAPNPADAGHAEGRLLVEVADRLRAKGVLVSEVTAGSTPTGKWVAQVPGITEVRAGNYVFNDLMQLDHGIASEDQLALSVLCTVVSKHTGGHLTIDGATVARRPSAVMPAVWALAELLPPLLRGPWIGGFLWSALMKSMVSHARRKM